jgi:hypothetical protein
MMVIPGTLAFKAPIINAIINPFGIQLCDLATPPMPFPSGKRSFDGVSRALGSNFFDADSLVTFVDEAINAYSNMNV